MPLNQDASTALSQISAFVALYREARKVLTVAKKDTEFLPRMFGFIDAPVPTTLQHQVRAFNFNSGFCGSFRNEDVVEGLQYMIDTISLAAELADSYKLNGTPSVSGAADLPTLSGKSSLRETLDAWRASYDKEGV
jgi:hypothetical protein